ncbi:MAG: hypothetical protein ISP92_07005, partial [Pseudomonadales bacterium]|nr:hypothetical protein [Pseudomonadales bacterium]
MNQIFNPLNYLALVVVGMTFMPILAAGDAEGLTVDLSGHNQDEAPASEPKTAWQRHSEKAYADREAAHERHGAVLSPDARVNLVDERRHRLEAMSPEEREGLMRARRDRLAEMSPEEREGLMRARRDRLAEMSPQEREGLMRARRDKLADMSP